MKALSIRQPWADCIVYYGKDIENRQWYSAYRGPLLIHAAKTWGRDERETLDDLLDQLKIPKTAPQPRLGGIVGRVEMVDCVRHSDSPWFEGRFGFVLKSRVDVPFVPCRGALGIFDIEVPA
jgi:hypothetical protein